MTNLTTLSNPAAPSQRTIRLAKEEKARRILERAARAPIARAEQDASKPPHWFHAGQLKCWRSRAMEVVACAGAQGGKSVALSPWLLREIRRCGPLIAKLGRGSVIFAGPTQTLLDAQAVPQFRELFEEDWQLGRYVEGTKPKFRFSGEGAKRLIGAILPITVHFCYAHKSSNLESVTAVCGGWDEAGQAENKQASYRAYNRRLKAARSVTFGQIHDWLCENETRKATYQWWIDSFYAEEGPDARFGRRFWATTPYEWGWFKSQVVDRAIAKTDGYELINWDSWLNPIVSEAECRTELAEGMPQWEWEMMYRGTFTRPAGVVFDCFDPKRNLFPRFALPKEWPRFVGGDFGNVNTCFVKFAEELEMLDKDRGGNYRWGEPTGRLIAYSLYKGRSDSVEEHARLISKGEPRALTGGGGSHQESGWRQAFRKEGVHLADPRPDERGLEIRLQQLYAALKTGDLVIFDDDEMRPLVDEITTMSRELDDLGQPTEKIKDEANYHGVAAASYGITWKRPPQSNKVTVLGGVGG